MNSINIDGIKDKLVQLDLMCIDNNIQAEIVLLGGSAYIIVLDRFGEEFRKTSDIDMNIIGIQGDKSEKKFRELLQKVNIDEVGGIMEVPPIEDFKDGSEITKYGNFKNITVYLPSIELLICCKAFSRRQKDLEDLKILFEKKIIDKCDKEKLKDMMDEYGDNLLNKDNPDLNYHYVKSNL